MTPHDEVVKMCGDFESKSKADLAIRAERQRERANKWRERCGQLERVVSEQRSGYEKRIAEMVDEIQKCGKKFNAEIVKLRAELHEAKKEIGCLITEKTEKYYAGIKIGNAQAKEKFSREIRIGQKELARRRKELVNEKIHALLWDSVTGLDGNDELIDWVRRAIKRRIDAPNHVYVVVVEGSQKRENSQPKLVGNPGYHTTPSGKTIVNHPGAYGWSTVYHCSTERVEVGRNWIRKNIYYLAKSEAEMKIK